MTRHRISSYEKKALKEAFRAPAPDRKEAFVRSLPRQRISNIQFLLTQTAYIPLWVWGLCCLPFPALLLNAHLMARSTLWVLSALMPFVAMSAVSGSARSTLHRMAELEMASRFSLKSIVLARMGVIGISHLLLLCVLAPLACFRDGETLRMSGICLLVPYLATTFLCLVCTRRIHGREALYACMGVAVMISCLSIFLRERLPVFYQEEYFRWWTAALLLLILPTLREYRIIILETEELSWNLS